MGRTRSVGEGTRVNAELRAVVGVDEGCKLCSVCCFVSSASLLSTMSTFVTVVGGSVSALTTTTLLLLRPGGLLLLLGKFRISLLALHSTKLVGLMAACGRALRALFESQSGCYDNLVGTESLDVRRLSLVNELSYNLHGRRELRNQDHSLHGESDLKPSFLEIGEVGCDQSQGMSGVSVCRDSPTSTGASSAQCGQSPPTVGHTTP